MHKLESFALSTGTKIHKPHIEESFYPIVHKKFICISKDSVSNAKSYDFYDDVLFHMSPYLQANNIAVVEIGKSKSPKAYYSQDFSHLNRTQSNYIIGKSMLYIGNNNFYANLASHQNKPIICPSNKDYIEITKPYWGQEGDCTIFNPISDLKPSFMNEEAPKTINLIHPETIASKALDALNIKHELAGIKTIYTGDHYYNQVIDIVPSDVFPNQKLPKNSNIRMDKSYNLDFLLMCQHLESLNVVTDKPIPQKILFQLRNSISRLTFLIDNKTTEEHIKSMSSSGIKLILLTEDEKNLNKIRLKFIDYKVQLLFKKNKKDLNVNVYSNLRFLSKRNIIYQGKMYNSYLSMSLKDNTSTVKNKKEFWEDLPFCRVYKISS